jgi:hypothetical protein
MAGSDAAPRLLFCPYHCYLDPSSGAALATRPDGVTCGWRLAVPESAEVAPWVETMERLWDHPQRYEREGQRCLRAAEAWRPERLLGEYQEFFRRVCHR